MDRRESYGTFPPTGTPITGLEVMDAMTPGRAAATPAMPTKTEHGHGGLVGPATAMWPYQAQFHVMPFLFLAAFPDLATSPELGGRS